MAVNLYEMFGTDEQMEKEGFWYAFNPETQFKLARAGGSNMKFAKLLEAKTRPYKRQIDNDTMDTELATQLMVEAFVEGVLVDWKGVLDKEGNEAPFNKDSAIKLLLDLPDLFLELRAESQRISNFQAKQTEEDAGNS